VVPEFQALKRIEGVPDCAIPSYKNLWTRCRSEPNYCGLQSSSSSNRNGLVRELVREYEIVTIERRQVSDQVVFLVSGRMDAENAPQFEQQCSACIAEGITGLVVDLGELAYISSMGLRSFVSLGKTLQGKGGALRICRLSGLVKQVFEITGLVRSFPVYESVEAALIGG